ncbi:TPA: GNAT family N-acetyltransferase, partial [Pseudomonas aeruginosa]
NGLVNLSCFAGRSALLYDTDTESIKVFKISQVTPGTIPMSLLLLADPSERSVASYCDGALCYLATEDGAALGASVFNTRCKDVLELFNIAVAPEVQARGIGTALLEHAVTDARERGYVRIELGTGTFGYQLAFYQRVGFRVDKVVKNYFLDNYDQPIYEMGIQHKDMLRLSLIL